MYYTIYKVLNEINNKEYIGQHQTENLSDNYMGSGIVITQAIKKYGKDNFRKTILFVFKTYDEMNNKEMELVTEEYIKQDNTYNISIGGQGGICHSYKNTTVARKKSSIDNWKRINCELYNNNKDLYETPSTSKVTIFNTITKKNESINVSDFNPNIHKKKFGGIVAKKNGKFQYVSSEEFSKNSDITSPTKGMVTVVEIASGIGKHIHSDEFHKNRELYLHNTEGFVTGKNRKTGEKRRFASSEFKLYKDEYTFSTTGQVTIYDINLNKFINIKKNGRNREIHKSIHAVKFDWFTAHDELICSFFGTYQDFKKLYGILPIRAFTDLVNTGIFKTDKLKIKTYNNSYIKKYDWKQNILY